MQFEIISHNEQKTTCYKKKSRIKAFFDKLLDKFIEQHKERVKQQYPDITDEQFIELLNEILRDKVIIITLDDEEMEEFRKISKRNYLVYTDTCTLLENGKFTTIWNGPRQFILALLDKGIKPPIRVRIGTNREGRIYIAFTRAVNTN